MSALEFLAKAVLFVFGLVIVFFLLSAGFLVLEAWAAGVI